MTKHDLVDIAAKKGAMQFSRASPRIQQGLDLAVLPRVLETVTSASYLPSTTIVTPLSISAAESIDKASNMSTQANSDSYGIPAQAPVAAQSTSRSRRKKPNGPPSTPPYPTP